MLASCPQGSELKLGSLPEGRRLTVILKTLVENILHTFIAPASAVEGKGLEQLIDKVADL